MLLLIVRIIQLSAMSNIARNANFGYTRCMAMVFKRKFYEKLLEWKKNSNGSRAILVEGARRIGKSTLCELFAQNEYKSYILIDFALVTKKIKDMFFDYLNDLDTFFMLLQADFGVTLYKRESVIIFDEVQKFPRAREAIKYLIADGRYDYIETGSLISIKENVKDIVIPSEERHLKMYPLDFEEFCWALGKEQLCNYIKQCFTKREPLERNLHNDALLVFKQYMLVGGMPQSLATFLESGKSFEEADKQKRDILNLYRDDIMKIKARYRSKVFSLFDQIPSLLSRHEKRVVFNEIDKGKTAEQYEETFFWLSNSMISNECFLCNDPNVGLSLNETRAYIKCYFCDTGLLVSHAFDENELMQEEIYKQILGDKLGLNEGMFYENVIAQMLTANGHKLFFYTHYNEEKHRNDIEIDFLISNNSKLKFKLYPIEVKSGRNYTTTSLERFSEKFKERIDCEYIIHPRNLIEKNGVLCIPPYMAMCL